MVLLRNVINEEEIPCGLLAVSAISSLNCLFNNQQPLHQISSQCEVQNKTQMQKPSCFFFQWMCHLLGNWKGSNTSNQTQDHCEIMNWNTARACVSAWSLTPPTSARNIAESSWSPNITRSKSHTIYFAQNINKDQVWEVKGCCTSCTGRLLFRVNSL